MEDNTKLTYLLDKINRALAELIEIRKDIKELENERTKERHSNIRIIKRRN